MLLQSSVISESTQQDSRFKILYFTLRGDECMASSPSPTSFLYIYNISQGIYLKYCRNIQNLRTPRNETEDILTRRYCVNTKQINQTPMISQRVFILYRTHQQLARDIQSNLSLVKLVNSKNMSIVRKFSGPPNIFFTIFDLSIIEPVYSERFLRSHDFSLQTSSTVQTQCKIRSQKHST